ncbi:MAG: DNA-deoxyinosine glycosylase [Spirochaetales bacterium]
MKCSFSPVSHKNCTILILGSLPSEISLRDQKYYANPRNDFWRIMSAVLHEPLCDDYDSRCQLLLKHSLALWDVVRIAERLGSSDSAIKNEEPNDIHGFLSTHTKIEKILCNGSKAAYFFRKYFADVNIMHMVLPSTSPANAKTSFNEKVLQWKNAVCGK